MFWQEGRAVNTAPRAVAIVAPLKLVFNQKKRFHSRKTSNMSAAV
jgi:hypothetical protein